MKYLHNLWKQYGELSVADNSLQSKLLDRATNQMRRLLQERAQVVLIDDLHCAQQLSLHFFKQLWDRLAIQLNLPSFFVSSQHPIDLFQNAENVPLKLLSTQDIADILQKITKTTSIKDINTIVKKNLQ